MWQSKGIPGNRTRKQHTLRPHYPFRVSPECKQISKRFLPADNPGSSVYDLYMIHIAPFKKSSKVFGNVLKYFHFILKTSVYKGYKQDKIEMRGDRAEMSDFPLYLNTVAGGLDRRDQTIGGFSFVVKIYAVPVVEIIG